MLDLPTELTPDFHVVSRNQILRDENTFRKIKADLLVADVQISKAEAYYVVDDRKTHLGESENVHALALAPNHRVTVDGWVFDSYVEAQLGSFLFAMNLVILESIIF